MPSNEEPRTSPPPAFTMVNITADLCVALAAFQAKIPKIDRNRTVEVETKADKDDYEYSYATLDHETEIVMPLLAAQGLSFTCLPGMSTDGRGLVVRYFLLHRTGGYIGAEWPISAESGGRMKGLQALGSVITYVRRYALQSVTGVAPEGADDDGRAADATEMPARVQRRNAARADQAATNTARRRERAEADREPRESSPAPATPERGYSAPRDPGAPVSQGQQKKLIMQFKDLGRGDREQRPERLRIVSGLMGKPVSSITELTAGEAHELIEVIDSALSRPNALQTLEAAIADQAARPAPANSQPDDAGWAAELDQAKTDAQRLAE